MLNLSAYPQCARVLRYQQANLNETGFTHYWAAACVASGESDARLTEFGGFDFSDRSDANGRRLLSRLEQFFASKAQRAAGNSVYASEGLKALLGSRGIKVSMLKSEDDYWTAAETLFPGKLNRDGGFTSLYVQITSIPKKERRRLASANMGKLPSRWLSPTSTPARSLAKAIAQGQCA